MSRTEKTLKKPAKIIPLVLVFSMLFGVIAPMAPAAGMGGGGYSGPF